MWGSLVCSYPPICGYLSSGWLWFLPLSSRRGPSLHWEIVGRSPPRVQLVAKLTPLKVWGVNHQVPGSLIPSAEESFSLFFLSRFPCWWAIPWNFFVSFWGYYWCFLLWTRYWKNPSLWRHGDKIPPCFTPCLTWYGELYLPFHRITSLPPVYRSSIMFHRRPQLGLL